jgi:oligogalacturonide lyase
MRLTAEPESEGLYFNENAFTSGGTQMIYTVSRNFYALDMTTYKSRKLESDPITCLVVGKLTPTVYFMKVNDNGLYAMDVNSGQVRKLADLPANTTISALNADETLIAGTYVEGQKPTFGVNMNLKESSRRATMMDERLAAHLPMVLFTFNLKTAEIMTVLHSTDWLSHVQFSPKDPTLLMYCHEGLWWKVDRVWTVHTDGSHNELIHKRTMNGEIAGHEFWDADGVTIWYDLQVPRGQNFYLASYNTDTGARKWYSVERDAWSIHYNATPDDKLFCGDGGDYAQVAKSKNGQWIELFSPRESPVPTEIDQTGLTQSGFFVTQHLVNMAKQDYKLEPNVRFSPDHKLVIFSSNILGPSFVFAVEV